MESKSVKKVDVLNILTYVVKKWYVVILIAVLLAGVVGGKEYWEYKVQKKNELFANANKKDLVQGAFVVYVTNFDNSENYYNRIEDATAIAKNRAVLAEVIDKNGLTIDVTMFANCITAVPVGMNQLELSVEGSLIGMDQESVVKLTEDLCEAVIKKYDAVFGEGSVVLVDEPHATAYELTRSTTVDDDDNKVKKITKKDVLKSGIIGGFIGGVLGVVAVIFYVLISTVLRTKDEVIGCFGMSLLGSVDKDGKDKEEYKRVIKRFKDKKVLAAISLTDKEYRKEAAGYLVDNAAVNGTKAVIVRIVEGTEADKNPLYKYITGKNSVKDMVADTAKASVKQIEWTTAAPDDIDLFTNDKFENAMKEVRDMFDFVVIDCPAANTSAAALNVAPLCDGVVVLGSCGVIKEAQVWKLKNNFKENDIESLGFLYVE